MNENIINNNNNENINNNEHFVKDICRKAECLSGIFLYIYLYFYKF